MFAATLLTLATIAAPEAGQGVAVVSALGATNPGAKGLAFVTRKPPGER